MQDNIDVFFTLIADKLKQLRMDDSDADWEAMSEALETSEFDAAMQAKLAAMVSSPAPEVDWNLFEGHLDNLDFDAAVHDKLVAAVVPASNEDWNVFESELDDISMDSVLKEKLEASTIPIAEGDWNIFESELDELSFDAVMRNKLETADIPAEEAGWALLASQLGKDFDRAMANKLGGAMVSGESQWPAMEDQLEAPTETLIVEKINSYSHPYSKKAWKNFLPMLNVAMPKPAFPWRSMAAAALLLLLAGSAGVFVSKGNLFDVSQEPGGSGQEINAPITELQVPASENSQEPEALDQDAATSTEAEVNNQEGKTNEQQPGVDSKFWAPETPTASKSTIAFQNLEKIDPSTAQDSKDKNRFIKNPGKNRIITVPEHNIGIAEENTGVGSNDNAALREFNVFNQTDNEAYSLPGVEVDVSAPDLAAELNPLSKIFFDKKDREKSFNGNIQIGWTHALLNSNTRLSDPGKPGYLSGIQLNIPLSNRLQLITGVIYGEKLISREMLNIYTPPAVGNNARAGEPIVWSSLLEADFTVIEIPVMLRYPLTPADQKLSLALQGGFSGLLVVNAQYRHFDPESPINGNRPTGLPLGELNAEKEMQRGGASWGNFRFAPVIGYRLSNRVVFEAAPYLQFGQQRIGTKQLKLHSAGGSASILIELGKKSSN